jgi:hypothetical protein
MKKRYCLIYGILLLLFGVTVWWLVARNQILANTQLAQFYASKGGDAEKFWILRATLTNESSCTDEQVAGIQEIYMTKKFHKESCSSLIGGYIVARPYPYKIINFVPLKDQKPGSQTPIESGMIDEIVLFKKSLNGEYQIVYFTTRYLI